MYMLGSEGGWWLELLMDGSLVLGTLGYSSFVVWLLGARLMASLV